MKLLITIKNQNSSFISILSIPPEKSGQMVAIDRNRSIALHHIVQPIRHITFRHWHPCIGSRRERSAACMRNIPVTIPAGASAHLLRLLETHPAGFYKFGVELCVAADAVIHNHL